MCVLIRFVCCLIFFFFIWLKMFGVLVFMVVWVGLILCLFCFSCWRFGVSVVCVFVWFVLRYRWLICVVCRVVVMWLVSWWWFMYRWRVYCVVIFWLKKFCY